MCLEIVAIPASSSSPSIGAAGLSQLSGLVVTSTKFEGNSAFHFSATGGCSCDFLSDSAEFECAEWALEEKHLGALAVALEIVREKVGHFSFLAHWLGGDVPRSSVKVGAKQLLATVRANRIGNNVLYLV